MTLTKQIIFGDNLAELAKLPDAFATMIYVDPPFNTGKTQKRDRITVIETDGEGDRTGFGGKRYDTTKIESPTFNDTFDNFESILNASTRSEFTMSNAKWLAFCAFRSA